MPGAAHGWMPHIAEFLRKITNYLSIQQRMGADFVWAVWGFAGRLDGSSGPGPEHTTIHLKLLKSILDDFQMRGHLKGMSSRFGQRGGMGG